MKKETLYVAFSTQKGGVGKTTFTVLVASYLYYLKGYNVAVVDCDYPQHSISAMRKRDAEQVNGDDYYKQLAFHQFKTLGKKAYPVLCSSPDEAIKTADEFLASERESIENDYQLRLFNLRLRLDTVRMKPENRKQVEAELKSVRTEMLDKLEEVNRRRNEIIAEKTAPAREAMQQRIAEYAAGLRSELHGKLQDDIAKDDKDLQQGPEAFSKVLAVIDGRLDKIKEGNDKIASEISHDIESRVTRLAKERGYTIVFNKVKVNVKADDITAEVIKELKKSK